MRRPVYMFILGLFLLLLTACSRPTYPFVRLNVEAEGAVVAAERAAGRLPLRVAIAAVISPKATFDTYSPLLDYLAKRLDRPVELLQRPTYAEINELLRTGQADIGFICGGAYVEGEREGYMELLAVPEIGGTATYRALIIVPADSPYRSFEDLRGRRFAFTDPLSNSGRLYLQYRLAQMGETPDSFFGETIYTYSHDNSIRAVAQGIVDGATVDSLVFDALVKSEPELGKRLRIIERSRPFGIPPVVVHPDLDPALKMAVRDALIGMHKDPQGRQALAVLHVDRFVLPDPAAYESIRRMAAQVRGWK
ncbi:MAG: phosphate/phosphite/phosphonate ABC transporter substrate-binding protein [Caldilineae bacterium]|nr:MAG: phosphate/phosphite/phosphonate ABC transporter substrate-binding protein [Caldilineae bacterium]